MQDARRSALRCHEPAGAVRTAPPRSRQTPAEQSCTEAPADFVRIAMTTPTGAMTVEVLLCTLHIATMELGNSGSFLYIRPRHRADL